MHIEVSTGSYYSDKDMCLLSQGSGCGEIHQKPNATNIWLVTYHSVMISLFFWKYQIQYLRVLLGWWL